MLGMNFYSIDIENPTKGYFNDKHPMKTKTAQSNLANHKDPYQWHQHAFITVNYNGAVSIDWRARLWYNKESREQYKKQVDGIRQLFSNTASSAEE